VSGGGELGSPLLIYKGLVNVPDGADNPAPDTMITFLEHARAFLKSEIFEEGGIVVKEE